MSPYNGPATSLMLANRARAGITGNPIAARKMPWNRLSKPASSIPPMQSWHMHQSPQPAWRIQEQKGAETKQRDMAPLTWLTAHLLGHHMAVALHPPRNSYTHTHTKKSNFGGLHILQCSGFIPGSGLGIIPGGAQGLLAAALPAGLLPQSHKNKLLNFRMT